MILRVAIAALAVWTPGTLSAGTSAAPDGPAPARMQGQEANADDSAASSREIPMPLTEAFCRKKRAEARKARQSPDINDDEPLLLIRTRPEFPYDARPNGCVIVEFTVGRDGRTRELTIVRSLSIYERSALRAVTRWRYCPVFKNGSPVETKGIRTTLVFMPDRGFAGPAESCRKAEQAQDPEGGVDRSRSPYSEIPDPLTEEYCRKKRAEAQNSYHLGNEEPFPVVRVPPQYPIHEAVRGLEGYVVLELTVRSDGRTKDIRVVESSHTIFERATIRALKQWRYCPVFKDGKPVETKGVRTKIEFKLEDPDEADPQTDDDDSETSR